MSSMLNRHETTVVLGDAIGVAKSATYTSTYFDLQGYEGVVSIAQIIGTVGGTSPTWDGKITTCDASGGSYADVTGATYTQVTASGSVQTLKLAVNGLKRFIKLVCTAGGTSPTAIVAATVSGVKKAV